MTLSYHAEAEPESYYSYTMIEEDQSTATQELQEDRQAYFDAQHNCIAVGSKTPTALL